MANFLDITQVYIEQKILTTGPQIPTAAQLTDPNFSMENYSALLAGLPIQITFRNIAATLDIERVISFTRYYNMETNQFEGDVLDVNLEGGDPIHVRSTFAAFAALFPPAPLASTGLYGGSGTIPTSVTAIVTDTLEWSGGRIIRDNNKETSIVNSTTIVEISKVQDFPLGTGLGATISLVADTTYVIRGEVDILLDRLDVQVDNVAIIGYDRSKDILKASTLTGTMITIGADVSTLPTNTEYNFSLNNLGLQVPLGKVLEASNVDKTIATGSIFGRTKVIQITNCEVRSSKDVWTIVGFELVDLLNTLVWFITGTTLPIGCQFQSCRHLEMTSCEVFNWSNTTASTSRLIEILPDVISTGAGTPNIFNAVVNLGGAIVHPEFNQIGLYIADTAETKFGTITSNTFIGIGLTGGSLESIDYDIQNSYIIQANQGLQNGNAYATMSLTGNAVYLDNGTTNPLLLTDASTVGAGGFTTPISFPISQRVITTASTGNIEYNSKIDATFFVTISATVQMPGNGDITLRFVQNGVAIASSIGVAQIKSSVAETITFSILGISTQGDDFQVQVESSTAADVLISELSLNGYQL